MATTPSSKTAKSTAAKPAATKTSKPAEETKASQTSTDKSPEEQALQPVLDAAGENPSSELKQRVDQTLANVGETPAPTMVNGVYVGNKKFNEETGLYEADPEATTSAATRPSDIFDRIADATHHEGLRRVLEEIARFAGMTPENTVDLPEGMSAVKSTASLRTDASGYGGYAAGGPGARPLPPGRDGKAQVQVEDNEPDDPSLPDETNRDEPAKTK